MEDHLGTTSVFAHTCSESTWSSSLTVMHWSISPFEDEKSGHVKRFPATAPSSPRSKHSTPDRDMKTSAEQCYWMQETAHATTILMTSNSLGDFIKCSVVSEILPESEMYSFADTASEIWTMFSNQPQTGRCLAFLHLVGLLCEVTSVKYEKILDVLEANPLFEVSRAASFCV